MTVAIVKDGQVLLARGYGNADRERHVAVTPETLFRIVARTQRRRLGRLQAVLVLLAGLGLAALAWTGHLLVGATNL